MKAFAILMFCGALLPILAHAAEAAGIETIGLYSFAPAAKYYAFCKACGYNMLQFVDEGSAPSPEQRVDYYSNLADGIRAAKKQGFQTWVILLSNVPAYPNAIMSSPFDPTDQQAMRKRLDVVKETVKALHDADGFTFFAADPGGSPKPLGIAGIQAFVDMTHRVQRIVKDNAPSAHFNANIWAVTAWENIAISPFKAEFWIKEATWGKVLMAEKGLFNADCGLEFGPHNYYRSLALKAYDDAALTPEPFPTADEIRKLRAAGTRRIWAWAHFLIDEVDDGYTGYQGGRTHPAQAETRYINKLISDMRQIGVSGVVSNSSGEDIAVEALNVYAFARFAKDKSATPEAVIEEFAGLVAEQGDTARLSRILRFVENKSTWQESLPEKFRLKDFDTGGIGTAQNALEELSNVHPRATAQFPLPEPPATYLNRIRDRLKDIAAKAK